MSLDAAIATFIRSGEGDREALAVAAFAHQLATNPTLAAMFGAAHPSRLADIPAVPVSLFKELDLGPQPPLPSDALFRTSGTTGQVRGVHRTRSTRLYDLGAVLHANARVTHRPGRVVSLCPAEPDSSLGHMLRLFGTVEQCFSDGTVHADTWKRITDVSRTEPIFLAATAFALDALLAMPGNACLDERSVVMVTGGFKGRTTRLDPPGLYRALAARLGSPRVFGEYGMTELSSQLWTDPVFAGEVPGAFIAPPWLAVYAVHPQTGAPVNGEGLLRFVDLANLGSVLAIETQDLGRVEHDPGGDRVTLLGRLEGAELRGCSLRVNG
ncbi:coenzyme F390 synthetase [Deltaproteobacteria bacterium]|nr:coenzyme F390 synthetase [Deltaproteobacteria bacterium]